jgi:hypothetical protein
VQISAPFGNAICRQNLVMAALDAENATALFILGVVDAAACAGSCVRGQSPNG